MKTIQEKKVSDIMIPIYDYPTVSSEATLRDALRILSELWHPQDNRARSGRNRVVIIMDNEPVGTFGIEELLDAIEPKYTKGAILGMKMSNLIPFAVFWEGLLTEKCREIANSKASDYMTPFEFFIDVDDPLLRASYTMVKNKIDSVAVRRNGRLVGIVRSYDIFREVYNLISPGEILHGTGTDGR